MNNQIVEGVLWKQILRFFFPIILCAFFQHFYIMVDTMIVGKFLGDVELAAVGGSATKLITLLINFFVGVSSGITAYASRYYGAKDYDTLKNTVCSGLVLCVSLGLTLSTLGLVFSGQLLSWMRTPDDTMALAQTYLNTYLIGLLFCVLYNILSGLLRGLGDAKSPLYVLVFCSLCNIVLDLVLVLWLPLGVLGVALATLISQALSVCMLGIALYRRIPHTHTEPQLEWHLVKQISHVGFPAGLQSIMYSLSNIAVQSAINSLSTMAVASWVAYVRLDSIVDMFVSALAATVVTFVGQNLGAGRFDRVTQAVNQTLLISYGMIGALVGLLLAFRVPMLSLFSNSAEVVDMGAQLMWIVMPMYLLAIPHQIYAQALRGLGKSILPTVLTMVGVVGLRCLWVYGVFPSYDSIYALAVCYPVSALILSVGFTGYYRYEIKRYRLENKGVKPC